MNFTMDPKRLPKPCRRDTSHRSVSCDNIAEAAQGEALSGSLSDEGVSPTVKL